MTGITISRGGYLLANELLTEWLNGRSEAKLGEACRGLERLCVRDQITFQVSPSSVSRLLRRRGFKKTGYAGFGYDREPVYSLVEVRS